MSSREARRTEVVGKMVVRVLRESFSVYPVYAKVGRLWKPTSVVMVPVESKV